MERGLRYPERLGGHLRLEKLRYCLNRRLQASMGSVGLEQLLLVPVDERLAALVREPSALFI